MYYVYILKDSISGRHYTGFSENLKNRLKNHKEKIVKNNKREKYGIICKYLFQ